MNEKIHVIDRYIRADKMPHMWCPGCGNGIVLNSLIRAIDRAGLNQDETVIVAGIGCSSRANGYTDFCGVHTNHGRAIPYATGMKMHNPKLNVIVVTGDGDCTSIGGNHFIQACRRNIDLTVILFNNSNYGMTGGQYSPTTPMGARTKTSVYGNMEPSFDVCRLAQGAGATYVARAGTYGVKSMINYMTRAILHKGFSIVDAVCDCPTLFGRVNRLGGAPEMMLRQKERTIDLEKAAAMTPEELRGRIVVGEFVNSDERPEYTEQYARLTEKAEEASR